ncbi:ABC transporter substrate-binding protein [Paenibacillus sp. FSL P4-0081]|uniref:ABC transporter substrate-binding protein n=1 Tax=unclassified Paenibacillus TaxID=185978 RepID=UPI0004F5B7DB|nr:ABC transporter substrate-binding protein [Paenibacillus sp. FSL P4-0081]AIQ31521.1 ABC transporter substrate-binding protein [Paenibacillus sp. FSL P4-0081]
MRRKVKLASLLLAVFMLVSMLAACASNNKGEGNIAPDSSSTSNGENAGQANEGGDDATKDPYEITLAMPIFGTVPKDMEAVQAEINKITQAKINATVKILPISIGAWQQQMNLMMSGGEKLDLAFTFGSGYPTQAANGQIIPMDDLLSKYGSGIVQAVGAEYLQSAEVDGKIYGVPTIHDYAGKSGIMMRKDLVEKHNIDVASIKTLDDLDNVFKTIKDNESGIVALGIGLGGVTSTYLTYDSLGNHIGVLPGFDNGLKVENYFESDEYESLVNKLHDWFKAGYVNKDAATAQVPESNLVKSGSSFSYFVNYHPGMQGSQERQIGQELIFVELQPDHYATTSKVMAGLWAISQNSNNPERAMMFLDLMYTDKDITNLMMWGIEGQHYVKVTDTTIDYPAGIDATTVGYRNESWLMGNAFLTYLMKSEDPETWNLTKAYNDSAIRSKALGFAFNTEPVKNEITAINNVMQQYRKVLETGTVDPAKKLQEFIDKLKTAGIDKVIAEKQKQLDAWVAAKEQH